MHKIFKIKILVLVFLLANLKKHDCWSSDSSSSLNQREMPIEQEVSNTYLLRLPDLLKYQIFIWLDPWNLQGLLLSSKDHKALFDETQKIWSFWLKAWGFESAECSSPASFIKGRIFCFNAFTSSLQYKISEPTKYLEEKVYKLFEKSRELEDVGALLIQKNHLLNIEQFDAARVINERLCQRKSKKAIEAKINSLKNQDDFLYEKNFNSLKLYIDQEARCNLFALTIKVEGLSYGYWGYDQKPCEARNIIEDEIKQGNREAFLLKIEGLSQGKYGYPEDQIETQCLIEEQEALKYSLLLRHYISALQEGKYGYHKNETAAKEILEEQLTRKNIDAFMLIVEGLENGFYGYTKDPERCQQIINDFSEENLPLALNLKIEGLCKGRHGYTKNIVEAINFLKRVNPVFINIEEIY